MRALNSMLSILLVLALTACASVGNSSSDLPDMQSEADATLESDAQEYKLTEEEERLITTFDLLLHQGTSAINWWLGDIFLGLNISVGTQPSYQKDYYLVPEFIDINEVKEKTQAVFTKQFAQENLYLDEERFIEHNGQLLVRDSGGWGLPYGPVKHYFVKFLSDNDAIVEVTVYDFSSKTNKQFDFVLTKENDEWKLDSYFHLTADNDSDTTSSSTSFGSDGCTTHIGTYHAIPTELIEYVGQQKMDEFVEKYGWEEDHNIVNFVSFCNIRKKDFAEFIDEHGFAEYNAEIIYSEDEELISSFFARNANTDELPSTEANLPESQSYLKKHFQDAKPIYEVEISSNEFPALVLDVLIESVNADNETISPDAAITEITLESLVLYGDATEFCAQYFFSGKSGVGNPILVTANSSDINTFSGAVKTIRARKIEDSKYGIIAQGGGPLAEGLTQVTAMDFPELPMTVIIK